jgi:hypothetical protein
MRTSCPRIVAGGLAVNQAAGVATCFIEGAVYAEQTHR